MSKGSSCWRLSTRLPRAARPLCRGSRPIFCKLRMSARKALVPSWLIISTAWERNSCCRMGRLQGVHEERGGGGDLVMAMAVEEAS